MREQEKGEKKKKRKEGNKKKQKERKKRVRHPLLCLSAIAQGPVRFGWVMLQYSHTARAQDAVIIVAHSEQW